jgi:hypothetical protein
VALCGKVVILSVVPSAFRSVMQPVEPTSVTSYPFVCSRRMRFGSYVAVSQSRVCLIHIRDKRAESHFPLLLRKAIDLFPQRCLCSIAIGPILAVHDVEDRIPKRPRIDRIDRNERLAPNELQEA